MQYCFHADLLWLVRVLEKAREGVEVEAEVPIRASPRDLNTDICTLHWNICTHGVFCIIVKDITYITTDM